MLENKILHQNDYCSHKKLLFQINKTKKFKIVIFIKFSK